MIVIPASAALAYEVAAAAADAQASGPVEQAPSSF